MRRIVLVCFGVLLGVMAARADENGSTCCQAGWNCINVPPCPTWYDVNPNPDGTSQVNATITQTCQPNPNNRAIASFNVNLFD